MCKIHSIDHFSSRIFAYNRYDNFQRFDLAKFVMGLRLVFIRIYLKLNNTTLCLHAFKSD
jgi:hypothetical protein